MMLTSPSGLSVCLRCAVRLQSSATLPFRSHPAPTSIPFRSSQRSLHTARHGPSKQIKRSISNSSITKSEQGLDPYTSETSITPHVLSIPSSTSPEHAARLARNEYGDKLPENLLSNEALSVYKRLYGDPLPLEHEGESHEIQTKDKDGNWGAITSRLDEGASFKYELVEEEVEEEEEDEEDIEDDEPGMEAEGDDLFTMDKDYIRTHPFTLANRFGTSPKTIQIPQKSIVQPIINMLALSASSKHLEVATQRVFGGVGLPYSPSTPALSRTLPQKPVALSARQSKMPDLDADSYLIGIYPHAYASITSALVEIRKRIGSQWLRGLLEKEGGPVVLDVGAGGAGALAWREVLRAEWDAIQEEKTAATANVGTLFEGELMKERKPMPTGKTTVVVGSDTLRQRAAKLLDNTTFIPRLPDVVPAEPVEGAPARKQYDVIMAPYTLWRVEKEFERKYLVQTLWSLLNPNGGILILLEKGVPRGFEVIAGAREHLLKRHIADPTATEETTEQNALSDTTEAPTTAEIGSQKPNDLAEFESNPIKKETGMIVAPCTNHSACPLYQVPGLGRGRKDYCYFSQRFIRPPFLQSALGARRRNHEDVEFSYVAVQRGVDLRASLVDNLLQGNEATERAFTGYGSDRITTRTQDWRERKAKPHADTLDSTIFGEAETVAAEETEELDEPTELASPPHPLTLPRLILPPLKRKGHIVLDLCTPSGTFERWLVTRRNGKQAYRDARKAKWGDLWALGAKTREPRRTRVGKVEKEDKGHKKSSRGRRKKEIREILQESGLIE
jgi:ribosomal protein RSM22 (predicted rRNA methylase)